MVRKDIWENDAFSSLTIPARLLYIAIITHADDEGCFRADAKYWSRIVFYEKRQGAVRVERMLDELRNAKLIVTDQAKNGLAGFIREWFKMQTLTKSKSKPSEYFDLLVSHGIAPHWGNPAQDNGREEKKSEENESKDNISSAREKMLSAMGERSRLFERLGSEPFTPPEPSPNDFDEN